MSDMLHLKVTLDRTFQLLEVVDASTGRSLPVSGFKLEQNTEGSFMTLKIPTGSHTLLVNSDKTRT